MDKNGIDFVINIVVIISEFNTESEVKVITLALKHCVVLIHQSIPPALSIPRATAGHLPALSVPGEGL